MPLICLERCEQTKNFSSENTLDRTVYLNDQQHSVEVPLRLALAAQVNDDREIDSKRTLLAD